jgi:hypothetical protein
MNAMMFAYVAARQLEIERQVRERMEHQHPACDFEHAHPVRDRLGRTLITWGEHLLGVPPWPHATGRGGAASVRPAA